MFLECIIFINILNEKYKIQYPFKILLPKHRPVWQAETTLVYMIIGLVSDCVVNGYTKLLLVFLSNFCGYIDFLFTTFLLFLFSWNTFDVRYSFKVNNIIKTFWISLSVSKRCIKIWCIKEFCKTTSCMLKKFYKIVNMFQHHQCLS